jgi:hypothetical protein
MDCLVRGILNQLELPQPCMSDDIGGGRRLRPVMHPGGLREINPEIDLSTVLHRHEPGSAKRGDDTRNYGMSPQYWKQ